MSVYIVGAGLNPVTVGKESVLFEKKTLIGLHFPRIQCLSRTQILYVCMFVCMYVYIYIFSMFTVFPHLYIHVYLWNNCLHRNGCWLTVERERESSLLGGYQLWLTILVIEDDEGWQYWFILLCDAMCVSIGIYYFHCPDGQSFMNLMMATVYHELSFGWSADRPTPCRSNMAPPNSSNMVPEKLPGPKRKGSSSFPIIFQGASC